MAEVEFSPTSVSFIETIFRQIHNSKNKWLQQSAQILASLQNNDLFQTINQKSTAFNYIPLQIRQNITSSLQKTILTFSFTVSTEGKSKDRIEKTYTIHLWAPILPNKHKIVKYIEKIFVWLHTIHPYTKPNCSTDVNIFLFLTDFLKKLPEKKTELISEIHANTAFTTGCYSNKTDIFIFREEEWFKVLMHESFHNQGLDFLEMPQKPINTAIKKMFAVSLIDDVRLYESYCETWANFMCFMFSVYYKTKPETTRRERISLLKDVVEKEIVFALYQCAKVLRFQDLHYSDFIKGSYTIQKYNEKTQTFSYYIVKCILLYNINSFLEFCGKKLNFACNQENLQKYLEIIRVGRIDPTFIDCIHNMESKIDRQSSKKTVLNQTLRMTAL